MYRDSSSVTAFMEAISCRDCRIAIGIIVLLKELDSGNMLDTAPDPVFWGSVGGKIRGVTRQQLTAAFRNYLQSESREKARNRQRKYREMSRENVTESIGYVTDKRDNVTLVVTQNVTKKCDTPTSPSSPSPAPFLPPLPPTPPITPYNPPNPNPVIPIQYTSTKISRDTAVLAESACVRERLRIDSAWETSERARMATAHRLVDWIRAAELPAAKYNTLYDLVYSSLDMGVAPDTIIAAALTDNGNSFSGDLSNAQSYALKKRGLL